MSSQEATANRPPENMMGYLPIPKVLMKVSLPMMISMTVLSLYNVIDSIFVGMISENALAAVSLAFPMQMLVIAFGGGTCVGINAILSRSLGERNFKKADKAAMNGIFLALCGAVLFLILGLTCVKPFFAGQTAGADPEIYTYGVQYLSTILIFSFAVLIQNTMERLLQSTGKSFYTMITQATGAIINIILDPIFIFGLGPIPRLEVLGAAIATILGQCVAACLAIYFNHKHNTEIHLHIKDLKPDWKMIRVIYKVGFPSIIMQSIGSVMNYGMNLILIGFSSTAVAVFGVYFKLQSIIFMPIFGLNGGVIPIVAYNYGAGKRKRIYDTIKLSIIVAEALMIVGVILFMFFPEPLLKMFSASDAMIAMGIPALRRISLCFFLAGICIIIGSVFQALGNGSYTLIVSVMRQMVVLLPAAYLLAKYFGLNAVWWSFPIAEIMSLTVTIICFLRIKKQIIDHIPNND
ncbi:MAG: MATE family efflux transporter [Firmicutes bacterium]|nr:MATE family efflux transporter [Bacillota bacterium]